MDGDHEITRGLADYDHEDELYELYELTADVEERQNEVPLQGVRVLAEAEGHPMVYVKAHGAGRVAYLAMGHDRRSLGHPTYRTLFVRTVAWARAGVLPVPGPVRPAQTATAAPGRGRAAAGAWRCGTGGVRPGRPGGAGGSPRRALCSRASRSTSPARKTLQRTIRCACRTTSRR